MIFVAGEGFEPPTSGLELKEGIEPTKLAPICIPSIS